MISIGESKGAYQLTIRKFSLECDQACLHFFFNLFIRWIVFLISLQGGLSVLSTLEDLANTRPSTAFVEPYDPDKPKVPKENLKSFIFICYVTFSM